MFEVGHEAMETKIKEDKLYKEIQPESFELIDEVKSFWDDIFAGESKKIIEIREDDNSERNVEKILKEYYDDLKKKSECPETLPEKAFKVSDLQKRMPEKNAEMREEFAEKKAQLKKQWEDVNGRPWPKYKYDVYSVNGKIIRKAGSDYDAHHIQPLGMGGKNEARNITPLNAEVHYDKQGVHSVDSPYSKLDKILGGME